METAVASIEVRSDNTGAPVASAYRHRSKPPRSPHARFRRISIAALRTVFSERTDLVKLKTSEERSLAAMLDKQG